MAPTHADVPQEHELELVHVAVLFRHGDRSPITRTIGSRLGMNAKETEFWISRLADLDDISRLNNGTCIVNADDVTLPSDSPRHGGRWPCGQLTAKGVRGMQGKGEALRAKYASFISEVDPKKHVYVESTNVRRTIRSAQSVLSGMFPELFENDDDERTIVIRADTHSRIAPTHSYELYGDLAIVLADDLKKHAPKGLGEATARVRKIAGVETGRRVPWTGLREVLTCRQEHGLPFPEGLDQELFDQIRGFDAWLWHALYGKRDFCFNSFRSGVHRIYSHLNDIQEGKNPFKFSLFSGHDNSIVALIMALELQVPPMIPNYGAMVTFEIFAHRTTGSLFVRPLFEGQEVAFATHTHAALCPFSHFQQAALRFLQHRTNRMSAAL
uniref:Histidine acid phosphatase n=1 Tax=Globisporangium ultimum (strain ATCC 200006 / CBS 805.95 / DAOM BR144) TaxID=431595 RepID=K3W588_GLOUD